MHAATRAGLLFALASGGLLMALASRADLAWNDERTGGDTTVFVTGKNAFSLAAANASTEERERFAVGNSFFRRNWVAAPSSTAARDGLGPHFNARSCGGCHVQDGRGEPPSFRSADRLAPGPALLLRLSVPGERPADPQPDPVYGDQLRTQAVPGVRAEGRMRVRWTSVPGRYADGSGYVLKRPDYEVTDWSYGPPAAGLMISPRLAPQLAGVGLLEAIPSAEILANAAAQARSGGPIRGEPNWVWDAQAQTRMLGRFGWKANVATLAHQTAAAFRSDMGITSRLFPTETCSARQSDCLAAPSGGAGGPEIDDERLADVILYQALLAPAARRLDSGQRELAQGRVLFERALCAQCHRPTYMTGQPPFPRLSSPAVQGQRIWPYTDLLLHDMGEALADGRPDGLASGRQWKTPPLWGLGLIRAVNGHLRLLHDGRADGVAEAVLWHGGEAEAARERFRHFNADERRALQRFVESL